MFDYRDNDYETFETLLREVSVAEGAYKDRLTHFVSSLVSVLELAHGVIRVHSKVDQDCETDILALWQLDIALSRLRPRSGS